MVHSQYSFQALSISDAGIYFRAKEEECLSDTANILFPQLPLGNSLQRP
jgi:hypothetical protein